MAQKVPTDITPDHRDILLPQRSLEIIDRSHIALPSGSLILPNVIDCAWVNEEYADVIGRANRFEAAEDKVIERSRSAHEVGFGRITKHCSAKQSGERHALSVAVKPFNDVRPAANEVLGALRLEELGVETYSPVGVFPTKSGDVAVVTKKRDDLMGLDRDTWVVGRRVETEEQANDAERNTKTVQDIARMFAWLHSNGIFHPDGQLKNWGVTPEGTIGTFDTERHIKLASGDSRSGSLAWTDIDKFIASLVTKSKEGSIYGVGMLHGHSQSQMKSSVSELFLEPYEESLLEIAITHAQLSDQAGLLLDYVGDRVRMALEKENWPHVYSLVA